MLKEIKIGEEVTIKANSPLAIEICKGTDFEQRLKDLKSINIWLPFWAARGVIGIRKNKKDDWFRVEKKWDSIKNMPTILKKVDKK